MSKLTKEECSASLAGLYAMAQITVRNNEEIKFEIRNDFDVLTKLINEHFDLVEKATPKKISKKVDRLKYNHYFCNSCSAYLGSEFLPKGNYCPTCGQALDWSEEDD